MIRDEYDSSVLLAATEVMPSDWRDLSALLERVGGARALLSHDHVVDQRYEDLFLFIRHSISDVRVRHWLQEMRRLATEWPEVRMVTVGDADYPASLKFAYRRPPFLFIYGSAPIGDARAVAVVGSRRTSADNLRFAKDVSQELVRHGITVVSGLASGADSSAHRGAIDGSGRTIAVVAAGIDRFLNSERGNRLVERIPSFGAIVSQFRPGSPPTPSSYLQRNGVISGLSAASLIVEATERSGSRNEADHAIEQGRPVLLWEPAFRDQQWAQHYAQNDQVHMVRSIEEVITLVEDAIKRLRGGEG
jgi:DNA processing protein